MMNQENSLVSHGQNGPLPGPSAKASFGVLEFARRVERISQEINEFLVAQFEALEVALRKRQQESLSLDSSRAEAQAAARQKEQWQHEKRAVLEKLEADRKSLTEAWGRLETEQRKLLADRAASLHTQSTVAQAATTGYPVVEVGPAPHSGVAAQSLESSPQASADQETNAELEKAVRQSVLMQFQQLKNDVRSHASRRHSR